MEFDWTTFILEIVNFLILVWLLKHFFYRPILDVVARRRAGIEKTLADARTTQTEALALKGRYERRETEWAKERENARAKLDEELSAERERAMAALRATLADEREKARVIDENRLAEYRRTAEGRAIAQGVAFCARLLARLATPALEAKLIDVTLEDLGKLPADQVRALAAHAADGELRPTVTSAFPLAEDQRKAIGESLGASIGRRVDAVFNVNPELLAGLHISLGAWVLHANLRDELKFLAATA
jgi:F-type H+-transporting ATPase subunit b